MKIKHISYIYILIILIIVCIYPQQIIFNIAQAQPQQLSMENLTGEELFIQYRCVRCHTIGRGRFVGPDLSGISDRYSEEQILQWIENPQQIYQAGGKMPYNEGYPPMPPMNVAFAQAKVLKNYIVSLKVPEGGPETGSIQGEVLNKTNESAATGVELKLTSYMGDKPTDEKTIKSDEQGKFLFDNLPWDRSYGISVNFKGAEYSTDKMVFLPNEDNMTLELPIFEPTVEDDEIGIIESHMIVQAAQDIMSVADLTLFENSGQRIYVGGKELEDGRKESLKFNTPEGAKNANFIHGAKPEDVVQTNYGFADTTSIMPGQKRVVYTYDLPLKSGRTTNFKKTIEYPTQSFLLLISDLQRTVEVQGLSGGESTQIQGESYLKWTGTDLKPGHIIKAELKAPSAKVDYLKWGTLGFLILIVIAGIIYSSTSKKKLGLGDMNEDDKQPRVNITRLELLKEIAHLDDSFEAGQIDEQKYRKIREVKIKELKKLTRRP